MEFIFELIFELLFEGTVEIAHNTRVPKALRIIAGCFVVLFIAAVVAIIGIVGIAVLRECPLLGIALLAVDVVMIGFSVKKFIKVKNKR